MQATVIVPTYNESENIEPLVRRLLDLPVGLRVIVVDDNSPDGTGELADDLANALRARNWQVETLADGSLVVRQPDSAPERTEPAVLDPGCGPWLAPAVSSGDIQLPVTEWAQAHKIAQQWLDHHSTEGLLVGKIRKVLKIYLVSIVADSKPFGLAHQVAIRTQDGQLVVIH